MESTWSITSQKNIVNFRNEASSGIECRTFTEYNQNFHDTYKGKTVFYLIKNLLKHKLGYFRHFLHVYTIN